MRSEVRAEAAQPEVLLQALREDSERGLDRGARGGIRMRRGCSDGTGEGLD